ncbi:unnamed protein product [Alopecurus aequalis]
MTDYTHREYADWAPTRHFSKQLAQLAALLKIPIPMFRGKELPSNLPGANRWEIATIILKDPSKPNTKQACYTTYCPDWDTGLDMAMHEAMSRLTHLYFEELPHDSLFRRFGKRNCHGVALHTVVERRGMDPTLLQFQDLECYTYKLEEILEKEMIENDEAKAIVETLHGQVDIMALQLAEKDAQLALKNA